MKKSAMALAALLVGGISQTASAEHGERWVEKKVWTIVGYRTIESGHWETQYRTEMQAREVWKTRNVERQIWVTEYRIVEEVYFETCYRTETHYRMVTRRIPIYCSVPIRNHCGQIIGWRRVIQGYRTVCERVPYTVRVPHQVRRVRCVQRPIRVLKTVCEPVRYSEICQAPVQVAHQVWVKDCKRVPIYGWKCIRVRVPAISCGF